MTIESFWPGFGVAKYIDVVDCAAGSLVDKVLQQYIPGYVSIGIGGSLKNLDIKHMDALTIIKLSLLDYAGGSGELYELIVDERGEIDFIKVGEDSSGTLDVYYTVQTQSWVDDVVGVLVTGGKPLITRKSLSWSPVWGTGDSFSKIVYDTQEMNSNCLKETFDQYVTIVYNDPNLTSAFKDGIENLYEIGKDNPWDRIAGYVYYLDPGENANNDTTIQTQKPCDVPIQLTLSDVPRLVRAPTYLPGEEPACWAGLGDEVKISDGVKVELDTKLRFESVRGTTVDKFMKVSKVIAIGQELDVCQGSPKDNASAKAGNTEENTAIWIQANKVSKTAFSLTEGAHYVVAYDPEEIYKTPYIVLANNARTYDNAKYGYDAEVQYRPYGALYTGQTGVEKKFILPTGGIRGMIVEDLWVVVTLDSPSILIHDPSSKAKEIADDLEFNVAPIIMVEEPAPIAYNGSLVDLVDSIKDNDPTTSQDLQDTEFEKILDEMEGGGLSLSFSFMDESEVIQLSKVLYDYMKDRDGIETTYVCGPDSSPNLGGRGANGGIINSISYSYNDSGSYTISVNEGPWLIGGLSEVSGGVYMKQVEEVSAQGTIIQDAGNHIEYKVRIDGFGERWATNCLAAVLRIGDKVSCTVHNNPVED